MTSVKYSSTFQIVQPIHIVFPLFSPEGEKLWVPDWDYVNVMGTTAISEDYVFITKTHDHAGADAIWLVKTYHPAEGFVQFYRVELQQKVGIVSVKCSALSPAETKVVVSYEYIALSDRGKDFIDNFSQAAYDEFIAEWKVLLDNYFAINPGN